MSHPSQDQQWTSLIEEATLAEDYTSLMGLCRRRSRLRQEGYLPNMAKQVRVALLGGASTNLLVAPLELALETLGLGSEIYEAPFDSVHHEILDPNSGTVAFDPDVAVLIAVPENLPAWPEVGDDLQRADDLADEISEYWLELCSRLHERCNCEVLFNNFHQLSTRPHGNLGAKLAWDQNNFLRRVNLRLGDRAPGYVHINDIASIASVLGADRWRDPRFWHHAKQPMSLDGVVPFVFNTARIIGALFGRSAKCVVLDLDNTLWGGIVGDDGVDGIAVAEGDALGEAFRAFQRYLLALKNRGVLLAVCSKNEESNALAAFEQREDMILSRDDFVAFKANWDHKPGNLQEIAHELNLGLDALVFVDDNPVERELVRTSLPEVRVVELTDDPADYPLLLDRTGHFETTSLSQEDLRKTEQYRENQSRSELLKSATDYESFVRSLDQRAVVGPFEDRHIDRISQLINKSNQFNLNTQRLSPTEVESLTEDSDTLTISIRLTDKFGDNGLISLLHGHRQGDELAIDNWIMSCRVFNRSVEYLLCNHLVAKAREMGISSLYGIYRPTNKNALVREHYRNLGFDRVRLEEDGTAHWRLDLNRFEPFDVPIESVAYF